MTLEQVKRIATNAALFGVAAFAGAITASEGDITFAVVIAAAFAGGRAALGIVAKLAGFVTPGNPLVVNIALAFASTFASALVAGGDFTLAAITAAGYAAARAAVGQLTTIADNPKAEPQPLPD